jgi:hypothetical protein
MMDGIVPENNITDNPSAWTPESDFLSEVKLLPTVLAMVRLLAALFLCVLEVIHWS